jgi:galactose mutarotase-like enzyme
VSLGVERRRTDDPPAELWLRTEQAEAAFAPSQGFWGTAFRVRRGDGWLPIVAEPRDWAALESRTRWFGSPILFPFPLHVAEGRFAYRGRTHQLPLDDGRAPSHGVLRSVPWRLERAWQDEAGLHASATFSNVEPVDRLADFPFPFRFAATYTLAGRGLHLAMEATNLGQEPMPFGVGIHPYLPLPLVPGGRVDNLVVTADGARVARFGEGDATVALEPVPPEADLRGSVPIGRLFGINHAGNRSAIYVTYADFERPGFGWRIEDRAAGLTVAVATSDDFRTMVHWAPPDRSVVSPVIATSLANGFNLRERGFQSGVRDLEPGQSWQGWMRLDVTAGG